MTFRMRIVNCQNAAPAVLSCSGIQIDAKALTFYRLTGDATRRRRGSPCPCCWLRFESSDAATAGA